MVLFGIVLLFLLCHIGEVAISIYELADVLDGGRCMVLHKCLNCTHRTQIGVASSFALRPEEVLVVKKPQLLSHNRAHE